MKSKDSDFTVIVADGAFPSHEIPLGYLKAAPKIVCCDGSAGRLINAGFIPDAIVGDMDSLDEDIARKFTGRIFKDSDQETNDLTKAVHWCHSHGFTNLIILGATGKREDHTLGNISLLADYSERVRDRMVTDTGELTAYSAGSVISSFPGQQVSIFSLDPATEITSTGLKFPLAGTRLKNWWMATLNESIGDSFGLDFSHGRIIVYKKFRA
jgi:thiamine pyrophosphokinase